MKAISLWQPWASLWVSGRKIHETRHWPTNHRGWLAVHAAKKFVRRDLPEELVDILNDEFGGHWGMELPTGALIGAVRISECVRTEDVMSDIDDDDFDCGDWTDGRFGWRADSTLVLPSPIPYRGLQGMFYIPDGLILTPPAAPELKP